MNNLTCFSKLNVLMTRSLLAVLLVVAPLNLLATPAALTYQGRIIKSDGNPLEYSAVGFIFQITDPSGSCVIYQEQVSGYNMVNSNGVFDVPIGKGTVSFPLSGSYTILDAFNNSTTQSCGSCSGYTCSVGSSTYTPLVSDGRLLRVQFYDGVGWKTISPDSAIRSVPFAAYAHAAEKLGTNSASDFLLKAGLPTCTAGTFLTWNGTALTCSPAGTGSVTSLTGNAPLSVVNGTTTPTISIAKATSTTDGYLSAADWNAFNSKQATGNYITTLTGDVSATGPGSAAASIDKIQGSTVTLTSPQAAEYFRYNGTAFVNSPLLASDLTGTVSAANLPAFSGDVTSAAGSSTLTLSAAGTAGTYYKVTTDSKGRVTSGSASLLAADIPNLDWSKITTGKPTTLSGYGITDSVKNSGGVGNISAGLDAAKPGTPATGDLFVATDSQKIYRYNGASWDVVSSAGGTGGTVTSVATGTGLSGGPITGAGTISIANTAVTAGSYGSATQVPTFTVNAQGQLTAAGNTAIALPWSAITSGTPTTLAGYGITDSLISNLGGTPGIKTGTDATKPASPTAGTIYFATDTKTIYQYNAGSWVNIASSTGSGGTVSSVGLSLPSIFSVTNSPVTNTGTLTATLATQSASTVLAAPAAGGTPTFRTLNISDIKSTVSGAFFMASGGCPSGQTLTYTSANDTLSCQAYSLTSSQVTAALGYTPATSALNSGQIFVGDATNTAAPVTMNGDATLSNSGALTLASSGVTAGTYKSVTVDAKGRVTSGTNPTSLTGYGITDAVKNAGGVGNISAGLDTAKPGTPATGDLFVATDSQKIYRYNGASWDLISSAGGSGGTVTSVATGTGLSGGTITGTGTIAIANTAVTAGSYGSGTQVPTFTVNAQGQLTAAGNTSIALPWSAITSGTPTTLAGYGITDSLVSNLGGTPGIQTGLDASKPASPSAGTIYFATDSKTIYQYNSSAWVNIASSTGSGGTVTNVSSANSDIAVATGTSTPVLTLNSASANTASTIVKRDGSGNFAAGAVTLSTSAIFKDAGTNTVTIQAPASVGTSYALKLPANVASAAGQVLTASDTLGTLAWSTPSTPSLADGKIWVGQTGIATAVTPSGDLSTTNAGVFTVGGVKGKTVSAAPTVAGQVLRYDGTNWTPNFVSMLDLRSTITGTTALASACTASQTLTYNSVGDNLTCSNIAIADSQITYGSQAAKTFLAAPTGAAGAPTYRTIASTDLPTTGATGLYMNGGNSFGAAATLGTNDSNTLGFKTNNSTRMMIDASGNVGVGTTSPQKFFDVRGDSIFYSSNTAYSEGTNLFYTSNATNGGGYNLHLGAAGTAPGAGTLKAAMRVRGTNGNFWIDNYYGSADHTLLEGDNTNNNLWLVPSTGKVGIGTTSPGAALDVKGAIRMSGATSGYTGFQPAAAAGSTVWTLPTADGTSGQFLTTDGAGTLSWANSGSGSTVTLPVGSAAAPSLNFTGDTTTGFYQGGAGVVGISSAGSTDATFSSTGLTLAANKSLTLSSGTGAISQTYTGNGTAQTITANSLTTGSALAISSSSMTNGNLQSLTANGLQSGNILSLSAVNGSQAGLSNAVGLNLNMNITSGSSSTAVGVKSVVALTGGSSTAWGGYFSASGASTNYGLIVAAGSTGISNTAPATPLEVATANIAARPTSATATINSNVGGANGAGSYDTLVLSNGGTNPSTSIYGSALSFKAATYGGTNSLSTGRILSYFDTSAGSNPGYPGAILALQYPTADNTYGTGMVLRNGAVGIGTTAPASQLDVRGGANNAYVTLGNTSTSKDAQLQIMRGAKTTWIGPTTGAFDVWTQENIPIEFGINDSEVMRISAAGNLGVGKTAPAYKLDVAGDVNVTGNFKVNGVNLATGASPAGANGQLQYYSSGALAASSNLSWDATNSELSITGGLGPGNSYQQLMVKGQTADGYIGIYNPGGFQSAISFFDGSNVKYAMGKQSDNSFFMFDSVQMRTFLTETTAGNLALQPDAGNVGIGTSTPSYNLHVVGTAGLSTGTAWINASDVRLKDIQGDYEYGLNEVLQLHTVRYNYKKDNPLGLPSDFSKTGFIAQEVQKVIPDAVSTRKDGYLELNVDPIHWAVVNAIKELYKKWFDDSAAQKREIASVKAQKADKVEVEALKQDNAAKEKEIKELKARIERIEKALLQQSGHQ